MCLCLSIQAPPKQVPKTIESMRVKDETMVNTEDTEVRSSVNPCSKYHQNGPGS